MYTCTPTDTHTCTYTKTEVNSVISRELVQQEFPLFPQTLKEYLLDKRPIPT